MTSFCQYYSWFCQFWSMLVNFYQHHTILPELATVGHCFFVNCHCFVKISHEIHNFSHFDQNSSLKECLTPWHKHKRYENKSYGVCRRLELTNDILGPDASSPESRDMRYFIDAIYQFCDYVVVMWYPS